MRILQELQGRTPRQEAGRNSDSIRVKEELAETRVEVSGRAAQPAASNEEPTASSRAAIAQVWLECAGQSGACYRAAIAAYHRIPGGVRSGGCARPGSPGPVVRAG